MAELVPAPFSALARRMVREWRERRTIFDLPERAFFRGDPARDLSVSFHGKRASTPFGPAAGPQSQMAQNLVLSWLGGARILELKTVQVNDELAIPRPCIDMQTVGYNVEWSQELRVPESLEEYVKGALLVELAARLLEEDGTPVSRGMREVIWDMSVGYDLAGIRSDKVRAFLDGMRDVSRLAARLPGLLPPALPPSSALADPAELSNTLTLSTFHGCPPDEIERIVMHLFEEHGLHCIVKLNPMLLGPRDTRELLNERLGYADLRVPETAFERDTTWPQAVAFVERLEARALELGLGVGVKFTNTLIVANHRSFFPADQKEMYLSGPPLHVLAIELVRRFRGRFGNRIPISFSAGVDRKNFTDCVALGLVPVTVCSDLLKPGGYARAKGYFDELTRAMESADASDLVRLRRARAGAAATNDDEAVLVLTERYANELLDDPRYRAPALAKVPKKIGSALELFDCITCDKCIPVCPNDANFALGLAPRTIPIVKLVPAANGAFTVRHEGTLELKEKHQIANFADFCNECGNCDVFCPEDGGPYLVKPRFFGSLEHWRRSAPLEGFFVARDEAGTLAVHARIEARELHLTRSADVVRYEGPGFALSLAADAAPESARGTATNEVDLTWLEVLAAVGDAVLEGANPAAALAGDST